MVGTYYRLYLKIPQSRNSGIEELNLGPIIIFIYIAHREDFRQVKTNKIILKNQVKTNKSSKEALITYLTYAYKINANLTYQVALCKISVFYVSSIFFSMHKILASFNIQIFSPSVPWLFIPVVYIPFPGCHGNIPGRCFNKHRLTR